MASETALTVPRVVVSGRGAARLKSGHVWVYRSDLVSADGLPPGALVSVADERGHLLGTALYSSASQIAVRMISPAPVPDLAALLRQRLRDALAYRELVVHGSDACRLVFSEADFLPGIIVDRYNQVLSLQLLTQAVDAQPVRDVLTSTLADALHPAGIIERVDPRVRALEQLPQRPTALLAGDVADTVVTMNGVRFHYRGMEGQKTGAFLDQRENYAAAAGYARGEALDVFCYQGGFALHLAPRCSRVTGVDSSRPALELAEENARLNGREIEWLQGNAFDVLKDYAGAGRQYDVIVLDPPPFAKSRRNLDTALRGYKELNLRAFKMLRPGGLLVTCSCSYHVSDAEFTAVVASAAQDAHRTLRLVERRTQARDHPILPHVPETAYLKCFIFCASY